jgi:hypothetical protein
MELEMNSCRKAVASPAQSRLFRSGPAAAFAGLFLLLAALAQPAMAHDYKVGSLIIQHPWSRATPAGAKIAVGYVVIHNTGSSPERLVSVASGISQRGEIHEMAVDDKGVMTMRPRAEGLEIPAGGQIVLKPGSLHIMFVELKQPAVKGERFPATLTFENAGPIDIEFIVQAMGGGHGGSDQHGGHGD